MSNVNIVYRSLASTAAKGLRAIADDLESARVPLDLAHAISKIGTVCSNLFGLAADWDNAERKAA